MLEKCVCCEHERNEYRFSGLEKWVAKIDNRLWLILFLIIVELFGILGIFLGNI